LKLVWHSGIGDLNMNIWKNVPTALFAGLESTWNNSWRSLQSRGIKYLKG
jgi:hypothetical protein